MKEKKQESDFNLSSTVPDLSIVLVNYKTADFSRECIRSIRDNVVEAVKYEIILVDNDSGEDDVEKIRNEFPETILIENQTNLGFAKAVNQGIKSSRGKYIWLLNNDTVVSSGALEAMLKVMDSFPETGILGCRILSLDDSIQESFGASTGFFGDFVRKFFMNKLLVLYSNPLIKKIVDRMYSKDREVGWVCGACMLCRKEALEEAGLMDENFFMYREDVDLCVEVRKRGWKVRYTPAASIFHHRGVSVAKRDFETAVEYRKSQLYFYKKHYGRMGLAVMKAYLCVKVANAILISSFLRGGLEKDADEREASDRLNRKVFSVVRDYQ